MIYSYITASLMPSLTMITRRSLVRSCADKPVKYLSPATSTAIIRVTRAHYRLVWAALTYITRLPRPIEQPCVFQVVRVSGTIRKSEEEAIRRAKASILRAHKAAETGEADGLGAGLERIMGRGAQDLDVHDRHGIQGIEDRDDEDDVDEDEDEDADMG